MAVDGETRRIRKYASSLYSTRRFTLFLMAGAVGAAFESSLLFGLVEFLGFAPVVGGAFAKEASILAMFVLNDRWTFAAGREPGVLRTGRRLVKSNVTRSLGMAVGLTVLFVLTEWGGVMYLWANVLGIGAGFAVNYAAESLVTWRVHREQG